MWKLFDDEANESTKTFSTEIAQDKEEDLVDDLIGAGPEGGVEFNNEVKNSYEMLQAEMGIIGFCSDTDFAETMDGYEKSGEALESAVSLVMIYPPYSKRRELQWFNSKHDFFIKEDRYARLH